MALSPPLISPLLSIPPSFTHLHTHTSPLSRTPFPSLPASYFLPLTSLTSLLSPPSQYLLPLTSLTSFLPLTSSTAPVNVVLFEGWMLGFTPLVDTPLEPHMVVRTCTCSAVTNTVLD
jgi:hypothetical protein